MEPIQRQILQFVLSLQGNHLWFLLLLVIYSIFLPFFIEWRMGKTISYRYRIRKFFLLFNSHLVFLVSAIVILLLALFAYLVEKKNGDFLWQLLLGIFTGLFVGWIVDIVESWRRTQFVGMILSFLSSDEIVPVIIASDTSGKTGPGETISIGLFYSAYFALFSSYLKQAVSTNIQVMFYNSKDLFCETNYDQQRLIFGGPKYNYLTRELLNSEKIPIHYPKKKNDENEYLENEYLGELHIKDKFKKDNSSHENNNGPWKSKKEKDYGLIIRLKKQIHISGCRTWGVGAAAKCIFFEPTAKQLVDELTLKKIDPTLHDYCIVVGCEHPEEDGDNFYKTGRVNIERVMRIYN